MNFPGRSALKPTMSVELTIPSVSVTTPPDGSRLKPEVGFAPNRKFTRKTSATSDHSDGPVRRKSNLYNSAQQESQNHHTNLAFVDDGRYDMGKLKRKKPFFIYVCNYLNARSIFIKGWGWCVHIVIVNDNANRHVYSRLI